MKNWKTRSNNSGMANEALQATGEALGALNHQMERMSGEVESLSREVVRLRLRGTG